MEIIITNWDKYNPKRDQKSYTWLRLSNDIGTQSDLFGMTAEMKFVWVLLLCEASKKNSGEISIKTSYLVHISQCSAKTIDKTVKYLESEGIITVTSHDTELPRDDVTTTPTNVRTYERTDKKEPVNVFDFESIYQEYPRKKGSDRRKQITKLQSKITTQIVFNSFCLAVRNYREYCIKSKTATQYIKTFPTFVNNWEEWESPGEDEDFSDTGTFGDAIDELDDIASSIKRREL